MNAGKALLVCAYDEPEKSEKYRLTNALTLAELQAQEANLAKDREIIFYCAWPQEATSARRAEEYEAKGFKNVRALRGGFDAWREAEHGAAIQ